MSVILYEDEKFSRILASLRVKGSKLACIFSYPDDWDKPGGLDRHFRVFAQDLHRANTATWNRQYPGDQEPVRLAELVSARPYANDFELLKSLRGLRYNLIDNNGGETNLADCMRRLDGLIEYVAFGIIDRMPQWEAAQTW